MDDAARRVLQEWTPAQCGWWVTRLMMRLLAVVLLETSAAWGAAVAATAGVDYLGRPLADQRGPIAYRWNGATWSARLADGGTIAADGTAPVVEKPVVGAQVAGFALSPYTASDVGSWPEAVAIGDVTGDGRNDVVLTTTFFFDPLNDYQVFVFPQLANGTLGVPTRYPYLSTGNRNGIVLADLDEDGTLDVVVGHDTGITVLLADAVGGLNEGVVFADEDANTLTAMDVDRDGHVDVISLGWIRGATIFFGDGWGGFPRTQTLATNASGSNDQEVGDLNDDGVLDLAVMSGQGLGPNLTVHRHDGVGGFVPAPDTYFMGTNEVSGGIGLGDVTGDGLYEAVLSRPHNSPTHLWIMSQNASGTMSGPSTIPSYDIPESVEVADLNGDGRQDVAVVHGGWNRLGVYLQRNDGGLDAEVLYQIPYASHYARQGLAVGDFSGDGCADVAIADYNSGLITLRGQNCTVLIPACAPTPMTGCASSAKSQLAIRTGGEPSGNRLWWKWQQGSATKAQFGDPLSSTSYAMCLYRDGSLILDRTVLADGLWTEQESGFQYRNAATNPDGVQRVSLRGGSGKAKIGFGARRENLELPPMPIRPSAAIAIQLVKNSGSGAECWESTFTAPFAQDDAVWFRDRQR